MKNGRMKFDDFKWLLSNRVVLENLEPKEDGIVCSDDGQYRTRNREYEFVKSFYILYLRHSDESFVNEKIDSLENKVAKTWAKYAMSKSPLVLEIEFKTFRYHLNKILLKLNMSDSLQEQISEIFRPYVPFITDKDYFKFAIKNLHSQLYQYFYILLILRYGDDIPIDVKKYPYNYKNCPDMLKCKEWKLCKNYKLCYLLVSKFGIRYDYARSLNEFQKKITNDFLKSLNRNLKEEGLLQLYKSFQQINKTGLFCGQLVVSYEKVLYKDGVPLTGELFLRWDNVKFFDGYYLVKHPEVDADKKIPFRVNDSCSRRVFGNISNLFMEKLPPLRVRAKDGKIIQVVNTTNLSSCISLMEYRVNNPGASMKKAQDKRKVERKDLSISEASTLCQEFKSRYLDYLCSKQLEEYKVICAIEYKVNASGAVSTEYSFIFTVNETSNVTYLVYENSKVARCTYVLPIQQGTWNESTQKLYEFFASGEVNKRQSMAAKMIDLHLPGDYEYKRVLHTSFHEWVSMLPVELDIDSELGCFVEDGNLIGS